MSDVPSTKPYLIRALHEWCTDAGFTPHLSVAVGPGVRVPPEHVRDGEIVLNVSALATHRLKIGNDAIEFQARFGGVARELYIPIGAVRAIYARENGLGMAFEIEAIDPQPVQAPVVPGDPALASTPRLGIAAAPSPDGAASPDAATAPDAVKPPDTPPPGSNRPRLTRVK